MNKKLLLFLLQTFRLSFGDVTLSNGFVVDFHTCRDAYDQIKTVEDLRAVVLFCEGKYGKDSRSIKIVDCIDNVYNTARKILKEKDFVKHEVLYNELQSYSNKLKELFEPQALHVGLNKVVDVIQRHYNYVRPTVIKAIDKAKRSLSDQISFGRKVNASIFAKKLETKQSSLSIIIDWLDSLGVEYDLDVEDPNVELKLYERLVQSLYSRHLKNKHSDF